MAIADSYSVSQPGMRDDGNDGKNNMRRDLKAARMDAVLIKNGSNCFAKLTLTVSLTTRRGFSRGALERQNEIY